ncbi:hypothetical protein N510_002658 [Firmicutes bacterium ASF500]|nr:hypothetical protein N510_002658 [Firmicutes bacterium ASF500]
MAKTKIALLYERLSRDDELSGESFSIQNQKIMLEDFARRNGYLRFKHFTDDGVSGTRFDRPGFMAMMEEVEDGGVEAIIVKDMSRLGRDYLKVGQVMEILRQRGVRLIAINDNVDTDKGDNDMTPFLNIMYEFYARDTSRKIKSVFKAKGMIGKHLTGFVPYGYLWDEKRENWIVDGEAADVVRRIYAMTLEGYGPFQIASRLTADKIEMPAVHMARHGEGLHKTRDIKDPCQWSTSTVVNILKRRSLVSDMLQAISDYAKSDRAAFIREVQEAQASQQDSDIRKKRRRLATAQKRAGELERLVCKIYEDNALGRLPDARYAALDAQYAKEQEALAAEITELEKAISSYDQGKKSAEKFIALIDKYQGFDTMTNTMLNEFVDKILVHERDRKGCQDTTQTVEIYFNFVGRYIPPSFRDAELTPEEQEAFRRREERRDKLHQAYLRRKASLYFSAFFRYCQLGRGNAIPPYDWETTAVSVSSFSNADRFCNLRLLLWCGIEISISDRRLSNAVCRLVTISRTVFLCC